MPDGVVTVRVRPPAHAAAGALFTLGHGAGITPYVMREVHFASGAREVR